MLMLRGWKTVTVTPNQIMRIKLNLALTALFTFICVAAQAADKDALKGAAAQIKVVNMQPIVLVAGDDPKGWAKVPDQLTQQKAVIFMPSGNTNGVADIEVTADGFSQR